MKQSKPPSVIAGENLKRLMKNRHLTQERFAEELGRTVGFERLDARTVRWWQTHGIVKIDTVDAIAAFLGVSLLDMLERHP